MYERDVILKEYNLNAEEILYLCALTGAEEVPGVEDKFMSVPAENLVRELSEVKNTLTAKDCLTMDFNGDYYPDENVGEMIDVLTNPDKTISFYLAFNGVKKYGMFYIKADVVYLSERTEDIYNIQLVELSDIYPYLSAFFDNKTSQTTEDKSFIIDSKVFEQAKNLYVDKKVTNAKNILREAVTDDEIVELILSSYGGKADYMSVKCDSLNPGDFSSNGMICIYDGKLAVNISFDPMSEEDNLVVNNTDFETERSTLKTALSESGIMSFDPEE